MADASLSQIPDAVAEPAPQAAAPVTARWFAKVLPPGPVADLLEDAQSAIPDRPQRVVELSREALRVAEEIGDRLGHACALTSEGFGLYMLSDHQAALDTLTRALAELETLGDLSARALALGGLASVHGSMGHYEEAQKAAQENLRVARALGDHDQEGWVLVSLANHLLDLNETASAIQNGESALRIFADLDEATGQARAHTIVGGALRQRGRFAEARAHFESALRLSREEQSVITEARALDDLGRLEGDEGNHEVALELHREALELRVAVGNRQSQAGSRLRIGETLVALERVDEGLESLHAARQLAETIGAQPRLADIDCALSRAYEAKGDAEQALVYFRRYHDRREDLLTAQARSRFHSLQVRSEADRAIQDAEMARIRTEELGAANRELEEALGELQKTQRRMVQAEKLASLGRLSAGLAHEIQNPLNFISNFAELNVELAKDLMARLRADEDLTPDELAEELETVVFNAQRVRDHAVRAGGIVRSLLGHVRNVGGERRRVRVDTLLDGAARSLLARAPDIQLETHYSLDLPEVAAAPGSLQRAFTNIIENAIQALRQRAETEGRDYTPTLTFSAEAYPGGVELRVIDNGPGIPAKHCAYVFEPFFTTKPPGEGTGLGLSLAYDIITEGHEGTLSVYSREGEGATFTISLPQA
ncbi:MAG: tetratricopeptide repeat protein [Bacteroidota bacterium]